MKKKVLFLCTGNSCRSQMAEGWARSQAGDVFDAYSAGIEKHGINPSAAWVMAESGVNITSQQSKLVTELSEQEFDLVITLCGHASENCPFFPGSVLRRHVGFDDPPTLAKSASGEEEALGHYRRVRDEIREFIMELRTELAAEVPADAD